MKTFAIIHKIGTWDQAGNPVDWVISNRFRDEAPGYALGIFDDKVFVNGIEIAEWTHARLQAMGKVPV